MHKSCLYALLLVLSLVGCNVSAGTLTTGSALSHVMNVHIVRTVGLSMLPPLDKIFDGNNVQELYDDFFSLPVASSSTRTTVCGADSGLAYNFVFTLANKAAETGSADTIVGCEIVEVDSSGMRKPDQHFWDLLSQVIGQSAR